MPLGWAGSPRRDAADTARCCRPCRPAVVPVDPAPSSSTAYRGYLKADVEEQYWVVVPSGALYIPLRGGAGSGGLSAGAAAGIAVGAAVAVAAAAGLAWRCVSRRRRPSLLPNGACAKLPPASSSFVLGTPASSAGTPAMLPELAQVRSLSCRGVAGLGGGTACLQLHCRCCSGAKPA